MLPINANLAAILRSAVRAPAAYASFQVPVVINPSLNTQDFSKLGSNYIPDNITALRRSSILEPGADTCDLSFHSDGGEASPLNPSSAFGRYFFPGAADNKIVVYIGLNKNGQIVLEPKGTYIAESLNQSSVDGTNTVSANLLDQASLFKGQVYTQFPPRLYGNQTSNYYNPNYALTNPSGDLKTWFCDAKNWMSSQSQAPLWAADYTSVAVYVGTSASPSGTSVSSSTYTIDYINGKVTFNSPVAAGSVVSVDARPLAMAPEVMLKHLFVDFGSFDPNFLKFDTSGILLPVMEVARDRSIWDIAKDIAYCTAPRGIRWQLYFNENGYLTFSELAVDGPPVKIIVDESDLLSWKPEFTSRDIANVVRASATSASNQPLVSLSYDLTSINAFTQRPTYDIPSQFISTVAGMDTGSAMALMNRLTGSILFDSAYPTIQATAEILPDPSLQVGDAVTIIEKKTGINRDFYIKQIDDDIQGSEYRQTLRLQQLKMNQDFMAGLQIYAGAPNPANPNQIQATSGLIQTVSINSTTVVSGGQPVTDQYYNPVLATWNGISSLPISITLTTPASGVNTYVWRWMYIAEDAYQSNGTLLTGYGPLTSPYSTQNQAYSDITSSLVGYSGTPGLPSDVRANTDTPVSRRYWWPLLRCSDWLTNDGVTAYTSASGLTLSSSWTSGVGTGSATSMQVYGRLRAGVSDYDSPVSAGFAGQALFASGNPGATAIGASSTSKYGVDFGVSVATGAYYAIKRKVTPAYLGIIVANTNGVFQQKRIPFSITT